MSLRVKGGRRGGLEGGRGREIMVEEGGMIGRLYMVAVMSQVRELPYQLALHVSNVGLDTR